jgi:hypothetical protein
MDHPFKGETGFLDFILQTTTNGGWIAPDTYLSSALQCN